MPYNFSSNRSYVLNKGLPRRILDIVERQGGISATETWTLGKKGSCQVALCMLYKRRYVKRFEFSTTEGMIYFTDERKGWNYGLMKGLIPTSAKLLMKRIALNGAVSTLELRDIGMSAQDISWFDYKLTKSGMIRLTNLNGYNIFYIEEKGLADYERKCLPSLPKVQSRINNEAEKRGQEFESLLADYYENQGFLIEKNKFFRDSSGKAFEIDILASKPELNLLIAVEAKNYERFILGPSILLHLSRIKDVFPRAIIHLYAKNVSYNLIHSPFWKQNPSVWLFSSKQIHEIYEKIPFAV